MLGRRSTERRSTGRALFGNDSRWRAGARRSRAWEGPAAVSLRAPSGLVTAVDPAATPPFEQVRAAVEREWFAERRSAAQAAQYETVLAGYKVTVQDSPVPAR